MDDAAWRVWFDFDEPEQSSDAFAALQNQADTLGPGVTLDISDPARLNVYGSLEQRVTLVLVEIDARLKSLKLEPVLVVVDERLPEKIQWTYHRQPGWRDSGHSWSESIFGGLADGVGWYGP